jgi:hypothetical protein
MRRARENWPVGAAVVLMVVFTAMVAPLLDWGKVYGEIEPLLKRKPPVVQMGPKVLLASAKEVDRFTVKATVEPRGYSLLCADTAVAAAEILQREPDIAVIVIDSALPQARRLVQASRAHCPRAKVIELRGGHRAGDVSSLLINTALN